MNGLGGGNETTEAIDTLVAMINATLGSWLLPNNPTNTLPTIGQMVASGRRALVTFQVCGPSMPSKPAPAAAGL